MGEDTLDEGGRDDGGVGGQVEEAKVTKGIEEGHGSFALRRGGSGGVDEGIQGDQLREEMSASWAVFYVQKHVAKNPDVEHDL